MTMDNKDLNNAPIFVVGVGRSGTSLLHAMLNAHSDIGFTPETHFYQKYIVTKNKVIGNLNLIRLLEVLDKDESFNRLSSSPEELIRKYRETYGDSPDLVKFYEFLLKYEVNKMDKKIYGDKDPKLLLHIDSLVKNYPKAKIIHIIRDPRDVMVSRMKAGWSAKYPMLLSALVCSAQLKIGLKKALSLKSSSYYEILYESLIENPETELIKMCNFLGVAYEPSMLQFQESANKLVSKEEMQWKDKTMGPLLSSNKGKWKKSLTSRQIFEIETVCNQAFEVFGYSKEDRKNIMDEIKKYLLSVLSSIFSLVYESRY